MQTDMKTEKLYVVLVRCNTILSKMIRYTTQADYTHAAISLDKDLNNMYSFSRRYTNYPFMGCFRNERFDGNGLYAKQYEVPGIILEIPVTKEEYNKAASIIENFVENSHLYKYNYLGLICNFIGVDLQRENRFLCSEFVYHVLYDSEICNFGIPRGLIRPQNFLTQIKANIVYEGDLKQYVQKALAA